MRRDTLLDFFDDLAVQFRQLPRPRRRLPYAPAGHTPRSVTPRTGSRHACKPRASRAATRSSSGARTGPSGSSRSGAASAAASSSCRSTTARRPTFSLKVRADRRRRGVVLVGDEVTLPADGRPPVWRLHDLGRCTGSRRPGDGARSPVTITRRRRRRDHLHLGRHRRAEGRRHHPSQRAGEHRAGRTRGAEVSQVGAAVLPDPLPEPAAAQPHVRPGDGDVRAADAAGRGDLHARATTRGTIVRRSRRGASRCWCRCRRSSTCCASTCRGASRQPPTPDAGEDALREALVALPPASIARSAGSSGASSSARRRSKPALEEFWGRLGFAGDPGLRPHRNRADRHAESSVLGAARARSASRLPASR